VEKLPFGMMPDVHFGMARPEMAQLQPIVNTVGGRVLLEGPRRIGKTMLVKQAVHPDLLLRVDLKGQKSEEMVTNAFRRALESFTGKSIGKTRNTKKQDDVKAGSMLGYIRSRQSEEFDTLDIESIFQRIDDLAKAAYPLVVFIDEVQILADFEGGLDLADRIRGQSQHHDNATYIFAGSNSHLLMQLDQLSESAFYKQVQRIQLAPIPREDFTAWIRQRLKAHRVQISDEALELVYEFARDIPGDIQRVLAAAYGQVKAEGGRSQAISEELVVFSIERQLNEQAPSLESVIGSMSESQRNVCIALAAMIHHHKRFTKTGKEVRHISGEDRKSVV